MSISSIGTQPQQPQQRARRIALVTGGGGGIGQSIAESLAADGFAIGILDVDTQKAAAAASAVAQHGTDVIWVGADVTETTEVARAVEDVNRRLGPIDVLVNCAGWDVHAAFVDTDETLWNQLIDINLVGTVRMTRAVLPQMLERGTGRVINIAGESGRIGGHNQAVLAAAKGGVIAFTKSLAREVVKRGITVNTVSPGPTATPLLDQIISRAEDAAGMIGTLTGSVPMGRLAQPQEVAPAVAFFASEGAGFITGQTLSVSGGQSMS